MRFGLSVRAVGEWILGEGACERFAHSARYRDLGAFEKLHGFERIPGSHVDRVVTRNRGNAKELHRLGFHGEDDRERVVHTWIGVDEDLLHTFCSRVVMTSATRRVA